MTSFIRKIKFLFRKKGELFSSLRPILGFAPRNIIYYKQALTHRSLAERDKSGRLSNNERLEFLGDAVIETIFSDIIYRRYQNASEGFLSNMRSKLVERKTLGRVAKEIGLNKLVRLKLRTDTPQSHNSYIDGNTFEALVGAIYLDRGFGGAFSFINRLIEQGYFDIQKTARVEENFKSLILEWGQKYKVDVKFVTVWQDKVPAKRKPFCCAVMLEGRQVATGQGYTKKECHQKAAHNALKAFHRNPNFERSIRQMGYVHRVVDDLLPYVRRGSALAGNA